MRIQMKFGQTARLTRGDKFTANSYGVQDLRNLTYEWKVSMFFGEL